MGITALDRVTKTCIVLLLAHWISRRDDAVICRAGFAN
jgi:hypothetical protein